MKYWRLHWFLYFLFSLLLISGCQKEEEWTNRLVPIPLEDSFRESEEEIKVCSLGEQFYVWGWQAKADGAALQIGRLTEASGLERLNEIEMDRKMFLEVCSSSDYVLHAFFAYDGKLEWQEFDSEGAQTDTVWIETARQDWEREYGTYFPRIQAGSGSFLYFTGPANVNGKSGIAVWGYGKETESVAWKLFLEGKEWKATAEESGSLLLICNQEGLDHSRLMVIRIDSDGKETVVWEGGEREDGIVTADGGEGRLLLAGQNGIRSLLLSDGRADETVLWDDISYRGNICALSGSEDGTVLWLDNTNGQWRFWRLERVKASEAAERKQIVLAGIRIDSDLKASVADYNMRQEECYVEVIDYVQEGQLDFHDALVKLYAELAAGRQIDLLYTKNLDADWLGERGYLEDLYSYMDGSGGIRKADILEEVLSLLERDGHVYWLFPYFSLEALAVRGGGGVKEASGSSLFDEPEPAGIQAALYNMSRLEFLRRLLLVNRREWIISEAGTDTVQREKLERMLRAAYLLEEKSYAESVPTEDEIRIANVKVDSLFILQGYQSVWPDLSFHGYPGQDGRGVLMCPEAMAWELGICKTGASKKEAWEFLSWLLSRDEGIMTNAFPILSEKMEEKLLDETTSRSGEDASESAWRMILEIGGAPFYCDAATGREEDVFRELLGQAVLERSFDDAIWEIIEEEVQPYFLGGKTLQEAADIICSRMQLFLDEMENR